MQKIIPYFLKLFLVIIIFNNIYLKKGLAYALSPDSKVSLLTIEPGDELYNSFGHSVIRIRDHKNEFDYTFNYGTFDFNTPNFYLQFMRGKLKYSLSVTPFIILKNHYIHENRSIYEQNLVLTLKQREAIFTFLDKNYLPENRYYSYDFFFDNCSTRIRDVFEKVLGEQFKFSERVMQPSQYTADKVSSFRDFIRLYLDNKPWGNLGIDLGLGSTIDKQATPYQQMFLPYYLSHAFKDATIKINGKRLPIVGNEKNLFLAPRPDNSPLLESNPRLNHRIIIPAKNFNILHPLLIFLLLLIITLQVTYTDYQKKKITGFFDLLLFGAAGLMGILLLLLWFATDHAGTENNYNLLWAIPLHLPLAMLLIRKTKMELIRGYFLLTGIIMLALLLFWKIIPQQLNFSLVPLIMALAIRAFYIYFYLGRADIVTKNKLTTNNNNIMKKNE